MHNPEILGFLGDGQLGRMLTEVAIPMGFEVHALGMAGPNSPAAQVGARQIEGALTDPDALRRLVEGVDVTTIEIEHIYVPPLIELLDEGHDIQPSPHSLGTIQDKVLQKQHLHRNGIPVAPFRAVESEANYNDALADFLGRVIVKTRTGGYDGRGNLVPVPGQSLEAIRRDLGSGGKLANVYVEQLIPFQRELAVVGVRDRAGQVAVYPVVETIHENNICHIVKAPAMIDPRLQRQAEELGRATIDTFEGAGVFAVEMFQDEDDRIMVNEVAPRVHNSGHFTIEGAVSSQFENHILAITGQGLGSTALVAPAAVMINILGTREGDFDTNELRGIEGPGIFPHWYGKSLRLNRKVGHITVLGTNMSEAMHLATTARSRINA